MPLKSLESLFRSERRSFLLLVNEAWRQNRRFCVRCHSSKIYRLADKRYRCARCGYTFHDFTRRWIGELNLTARQWLWIVKLFELEIPPSRLAKEVGISYPTALKAIYLIRRAIAQASGDDGDLGRRKHERRGARRLASEERSRSACSAWSNATVKSTLPSSVILAPSQFFRISPNSSSRGPIIFTGRFRQYDGLILRRFRLPPGAAKNLPKGKAPLDGLDSFWSFARPRLGKFHRSSDQDLFYFLKELVFRYEHRDEELFDSLVSLMTKLMPND